MSQLHSRPRVGACLFALLLALAGCGGGGGTDAGAGATPSPSPSPSPSPLNHAPLAVFSASAASVAAGGVVGFDARASSDADGDTLTYHWDFGDGTRGGGALIAHPYAAAGSYTARLTVSDGRGGSASSTQAITATAGPADGPGVTVNGSIDDGVAPLAGVTVQLVDGSASGSTDASGQLSLALPSGRPLVLRLTKAGYADQIVPLAIPTGAASSAFNSAMLLREAAQPLDAAAGGTLTGKHGASITLAPNALVDAGGNPVTGTVQISMSPLDIRGGGAAKFPGSFTGIAADGRSGPLASFGTTEFVLTAGGNRVQLAPGQTATIDLPIYALLDLDGSSVGAGHAIDLWSLDERSGQWVQEGTGTVVASAASPSGFVMRASVSHFTVWNSDRLTDPSQGFHPIPQCLLSRAPGQPKVATACSIGPVVRASVTLPADYHLYPSYMARIDVPAAGGVPMSVPPGVDVTLFACTTSGVLACGNIVVNGVAGTSRFVAIDLAAPTSASCTSPPTVTVPSVTDLAIDALGVACADLVVTTGTSLTVGVTTSTTGTISGTKTLLDAANVALGSAAWSATTVDAAPVAATVAAGTYHVQIINTADAAGHVNLQVGAVGLCSVPEVVTPPATRTVQVAALSSACFTVAQATPKKLTVAAFTSTASPLGTKVLSNPQGVQLQSKPLNSGGSDLQPVVQAVPPGNYRLQINNTKAAAMTVTVNFSDTDLPVQNVTVPSVTNVTVPLNAAGALTFTPTAGTSYVGMTRSVLSMDASGASAAATASINFGNTSLVVTPATADPVSFVLSNSASGASSFQVKIGPLEPLAFGTTQTVPSVTGAADLYVRSFGFTAAAGDTLSAMVRSASGTVGAAASLGLFTLGGTELEPINLPSSFRTNATLTAVTLPTAGTYRLDVASNSFADLANLSLALNLLPDPTPLPLTGETTTVSGNIAQLAQEAAYLVAAVPGDVLAFAVDVASGPTRLFPSLYLHVPAASGSPYRAPTVVPGGQNSARIRPNVVGTTYFTEPIGLLNAGNHLVQLVGGGTAFGTGDGNTIDNATGLFTLRVFKSTPRPLAFDTVDNLTPPQVGYAAYTITVPADGDYRLCASAAGAVRMHVFDTGGAEQFAQPAALSVWTLAAGTYQWTLAAGSATSAVWRLASTPLAAPCF